MAKNKNICNASVEAKSYGNQIESLESLLRRFKRKCEKADLMRDIRKHDYYIKPSVRRKLKDKYAMQRTLREERKSGKVKGGSKVD